MKKLTLVVCTLLLASSLSFAGGPRGSAQNGRGQAERRAQMEAARSSRLQHLQQLNTLTERYNNASNRNKPAVRTEIRALIATQTGTEITQQREILAAQRARIDRFEARILETEQNKEAHINRRLEEVLTSEGQAQLQNRIQMLSQGAQRGNSRGQRAGRITRACRTEKSQVAEGATRRAERRGRQQS